MASHTLSTIPRPTQCSQPNFRRLVPISASLTQNLKPHSLQSPWLGFTKLSLQTFYPRPSLPIHRPIKATVLCNLPTANPERVASSEKTPKWSLKAIKAFAIGELEARRLRSKTTGTEALLMGIMNEGTSLAAKILWANGITLFKVREECLKLFGRPDITYYSPMSPPLTEAAQKALDWAVDEKLKLGEDGEVTTIHLLLGVWYQEGSPGHKIMADLGFNDEKAKELHSVLSKPGFVDD